MVTDDAPADAGSPITEKRAGWSHCSVRGLERALAVFRTPGALRSLLASAPRMSSRGIKRSRPTIALILLPTLPDDRTVGITGHHCGPGTGSRFCGTQGIATSSASIPIPQNSTPPLVAGGSPASRGGFRIPCRSERGVRRSIVPEQELNHLTLDETVEFLQPPTLCAALRRKDRVVCGQRGQPLRRCGEPFPEHRPFLYGDGIRLRQLLTLGGFVRIEAFPLKLYVFYRNPLNYLGLIGVVVLEAALRIVFRLYGKKVQILSKKIGAVAFRA